MSNNPTPVRYDVVVTVLAEKLDQMSISAMDLSYILAHCYDKSKEEILDDIVKIRSRA